uniref:JmjC domain-containing protein n=1 Tax=Romanomermis culicivorax TaxID=13658 RepID=A0A915L3Q1_ROMCU
MMDIVVESVVKHCHDGGSPSTLSPEELRRIEFFDSRQFGFINLLLPTADKSDRKLIVKSIQYYTQQLDILHKNATKDIEMDVEETKELSDNNLEGFVRFTAEMCQIILKLGHLHLLTEDYVKALSAYQNYYNSSAESVKDPTALYGLGIVYFHFKQYDLVIEIFRDLLYSYPNFDRNRDVDVRLGMCYKMIENWELALKHLNAAYVSSETCTFSKLESNVRFHIACCYDDQDDFKRAKEEYDAITNDRSCTTQLKAAVLRQIGWLFFRFDCVASENKGARLNYAVEYLQESIKLDPSCGKTYYLLGRCLSAAGRAQESFLAYRSSIDKTEYNADTWCSIGVLYQKQQQPMDALQAYICAVQLDEHHTEAWVDLGLLYEKYGQPEDALKCYQNASKINLNGKSDLSARIKLLEKELEHAPVPPPNFTKTLTSLEEAWKLNIPADSYKRQDEQQKEKIAHYIHGPRLQSLIEADEANVQKPPCLLNPQQIQLMQILLQNQSQLNAAQLHMLRQLQEAFAVSQFHLQQHADKVNQQRSLMQPNQHSSADIQLRMNSADAAGELPQVTQEDLQAFLGVSNDAEDIAVVGGSKIGAVSCVNPNANTAGDCVSHLQSSNGAGGCGRDQKHDPILSAAFLSSNEHSNSLQEIDMSSSNSSSFMRNSLLANQNVLSSPSNLAVSSSKMPAAPVADLKIPSPCNLLATIKQPLNTLTARQIVESAKLLSSPLKEMGSKAFEILDELTPPPPLLADLPPVAQEKLLLPTPTILVNTKKEAFSVELQQFCYKNHVAVLRGISSALRLDLGLFSTKTLMETAGEHQVEVRTQYCQPSDQNFDVQTGSKTWYCESTRSFTTVSKYAQYQAQSFQQALKEEQEKLKATKNSTHFSSSDHHGLMGEDGKPAQKIIKFGTNVDLSDDKKWKMQLEELGKLPPFCRVLASSNMLSHLGHIVLGMNTVQLYMKVPGCRTPGHQENNNFASLNINIGPGECEWFCVPHEYWGIIKHLCEKNKLDFLRGSWWPPLQDLWENNVPVFRFTQKPGDVVWVGPGTVHWVQATGWCNNIAWNIGSMTPVQYQLALERYEWNKVESYKSIVPMEHLSWQLARNVKFSDPKFYELIKSVLVRCLYYCASIKDFVTSKLHKEMKHHPRVAGEMTHYCIVCEREVFSILFVSGQERKCYVHCLHCALRIDPDLKNFVVLYQYPLEELISTFDNFQLIP